MFLTRAPADATSGAAKAWAPDGRHAAGNRLPYRGGGRGDVFGESSRGGDSGGEAAAGLPRRATRRDGFKTGVEEGGAAAESVRAGRCAPPSPLESSRARCIRTQQAPSLRGRLCWWYGHSAAAAGRSHCSMAMGHGLKPVHSSAAASSGETRRASRFMALGGRATIPPTEVRRPAQGHGRRSQSSAIGSRVFQRQACRHQRRG